MSGTLDNVAPLRPRRPCPECGRPSLREAFPFCSQRCKSIDLNRWFSGAYVIPAADAEDVAEQSVAEDETP